MTSTLTASILVDLFTAPARKGLQAMEKLAKVGENTFFINKLICREVSLLSGVLNQTKSNQNSVSPISKALCLGYKT